SGSPGAVDGSHTRAWGLHYSRTECGRIRTATAERWVTGFALLEVARKAPAFPTSAAHMGQEGERPRAHDLGLGIARVLLQLGGRVNAMKGEASASGTPAIGLRSLKITVAGSGASTVRSG